jgi:hypothetical protein
MVKKQKRFERGCPFLSTPECFDWAAISRDPESAGMSAEQIEQARISPTQQLYWCSECRSIWFESGHNFATRLGYQDGIGSPFTPTTVKFDTRYLGD